MATKILIIDDDTSFRKLLEMRLRSIMSDAEFTVFDNLTSAREFISQQPSLGFDLVVLDEHLPDGRGIEFLGEGWFRDLAVLSVSSDEAPEIPGSAMQAGASFFLGKRHISDPLFKPLVLGILQRNRLQRELMTARIKAASIESVKTLVSTLRHEINNPLGAVLGAAFLMGKIGAPTPEQKEAAQLVESSGKRIKHVLDQLCQAIELEEVTKANQRVYHIPGDAPWEEKK